MKDQYKTKEQLITELLEMRRQVAQLEESEAERKRAEEALRESEERYRLLAENVSDIIWTTDMDLRYTYISPSATRLRGYTPEEALSQTIEEVVAPDSLRVIKRVLAEELAIEDMAEKDLNRARTVDLELKRKDGSTVWTELKMSFLRDRENRAVGIIGVTRDITERKRAEEALAEEGRLRNLLLDSLPHPAMLIRGDRTVLAANAVAKEAGAKVGGLCWRDFGQSKYISEEDKRYVNEHRGVPPNGTHCTFCLADQALETRGATRAPEIHAFGRIWDANWVSIGDDVYLHYAVDITDRKRADGALREQRDKAQSYLDVAGVMMVAVGANEEVTLINKKGCEVLGYKEEEIVGKNWFDTFVPVEISEEVRAVFRKLMAGEIGPVEYFENPVVTKTGEQKLIAWHNTTLADRDGSVLGTLSSGEDITERKRVQEALRESEGRYRHLFEQLNDAAFVADADTGVILDANKEAEVLLARTRDEIIGMHQSELHPPDNEEEYRQKFALHVAAERAVEFDGEIVRKDGSVVPVIISAASLTLGERRLLVGLFHDITERKRTEDLINAQRDLAMALSAAGNLEEGLRLCLKAALDVSGLDCGAVYLVDESSGALDLVLDEGLSPGFVRSNCHFDAESPYVRLVMVGEPVYTEHVELTTPPLDEDERREGLRAIAVLPVRHEDRVVGCLNVASHALDEVPDYARAALETIAAQVGSAIARLRAEEALRESEEKFRHLTERSLTAIAIHQAGEFIYVNPYMAELLGYEVAGLEGLDPLKIVHPDDHATVVSRIRSCERGEEVPPRHEARFVTADGKTIWGDVLAVEVTYQGRPALYVNAIDITERKQAEEEVRDSREELRRLSAHMRSAREEERTSIAREVHDELGQALTALKMDLSWLSRRLPESDELLSDKTRSMSALIDSTIQKTREITTELRPGLLDDLGLVAAIEWQAEEFERRTEIACDVNCDPEDMVLGEEVSTALFRIFQETLTNVARHANATSVKASLREEDGRLVLRVKDDGRGITKQQISDRKAFGLLGMRERAHYLGGEVEISGVRGRGTSITVTIPAAGREETR